MIRDKKGSTVITTPLVIALGLIIVSVLIVLCVNIITPFIWYEKLSSTSIKYVYVMEEYGYLTNKEAGLLKDELTKQGFDISDAKKNGAKFLFFCAPNKNSIYSEYMPARYPAAPDGHALQWLAENCAVPIVDALGALGALETALIPMDAPLSHLPAVRVGERSRHAVLNGNPLKAAWLEAPAPQAPAVRVYLNDEFAGIGAPQPNGDVKFRAMLYRPGDDE